MPFLVGGIAAMVALTAGILGHVDPLATLWRALLAFSLGWVGANLWYVLINVNKQALVSEDSADTPSLEKSA